MPRHLRGARGGCVVLVSAVVLAAGCGRDDGRLPTQPVSGKVTLDGKALPGAEIWLVPADSNAQVKNAKMTVRPAAKSNADGTFAVTSYLAADGAPLGEYAVMVVLEGAQAATEEEGENDTPAEKRPKGKGRRASPLPPKYSNPATSGLSFTVKDGPNTLDLDLKSR